MNNLCPQISIVTPTYNQGSFIEETILSVKKQNYPNCEHVVIDGNSTDDTISILQRYPHLTWVSEPDRGQSHALNKGLGRAGGDIIGWLNSDDLYMSHTLHTVAKVFAENPEIDIVYGDLLLIDVNGYVLKYRREIQFDFNIALYGVCDIGQPELFFRKRVLDKAGLLDESFHMMMDREWWLRMAKSGCRFLHIPVVLAALRWHTGCKSISQVRKFDDERKVLHDKYWNTFRFRNRRMHKAHLFFLHNYYRIVRQWKKLFTRGVIDIPIPRSWYLKKNHKKHFYTWQTAKMS